MTDEKTITTELSENRAEQSCTEIAGNAREGVIAADEKKERDDGRALPEKKRGVFARFGGWIKSKAIAFKSAMKERGTELQNAKKKRMIAIVSFVALAVFFILFYLFIGLNIVHFVKDPQGFKQWIEGFDEGSVIIFVLLRVAMTVFRVIPGGPLQVAGGYAFGTWWGALWCMVGSLIGTLIIFFLGKKYGTKLVGLFVSPEKMRSAALFKDAKKRNLWLFLMNFLPGTPKDIFTWVAALSNDGAGSSIAVILLSRIPSVIVSTWCGDQLMQENYLLSGIVFGVMFVIGLVCSAAYKKMTGKKQTKDEAIKDENHAEE
ncbi:MAG: VTT domain-containing protein [Candidatus Borkfalkiaceae bacterium]|nr:VTT domain-containing protein [Clostridia bacterium]MDY6222584.1 VTT domain-containing protein [Christensenellaceae bacterium]